MSKRANGEGSRYRDSRGFYNYKKQMTMPDGTVKTIRRRSAKSYKQAQEKAEADIARLEKEQILKCNAEKLLKNWMETWLEQYVRTGTKLKTYQNYRQLLVTHVLPVMGDQILDDISAVQWQQHFSALIDQGLSPNTVCNIRRRLSTMYNAAINTGAATSNPITKTKPPKAVKPDYRVLTAEETREFIKLAGEVDSDYYNHMMPVVYTLAIKTGMRKGEMFGLMWQDIDLEHRSIHLSHNLSNDESSRPYIGTLKTDSSNRIIMIDENDVAMLREWHEWLGQHREAMGNNYIGCEYDVVFPSLKGTLIRFTTFARRHFRPLCDKMGLPKNFTFHSLRHTCATLLLLADQHPKIVQERLGHSSIAVTMDRYSQYLPSMQQKAVDAMTAIFA